MRGLANQSPRHSLLERLERYRERCSFWLANEQMDVFWHYNVAIDAQLIAESDAFESCFKDKFCRIGGERQGTMVAAECHEVGLSGLVKSLQSPRHEAVYVSKQPHSSAKIWHHSVEWRQEINYPTQAKRGLEWATRQLWATCANSGPPACATEEK